MTTRPILFVLTSLLTTVSVAHAQNPWFLEGNAGTDPDTQFLGTKDNNPLAMRTLNLERLRIDPLGNVGVGTTKPSSRLDVAGQINAHKADEPLVRLILDPTFRALLSVKGPGVSAWEPLLLGGRYITLWQNGMTGKALGFTDRGLVLSGYGLTIERTPQIGTWNARVPITNITTHIATFDPGIEFPSIRPAMTIGIDGLPIIAYRKQVKRQNLDSGDLEVVHCGNLECTSGNTITTLEQGSVCR